MRLLATEKAHQNQAAVDPWTGVHLAAGLALGLVEVPLDRALGAAVGYEIAEQYLERQDLGQEIFESSGPETLVNAVADLAFFAAGHWLGRRWNRTGGTVRDGR